jgi:myo-inositol-1(or 4)-monophosphatase
MILLPLSIQQKISAAWTQRFYVGIQACLMAGQIQKNAQGKTFSIQTKSSDKDLVTEVDHACDEAIIAHIHTFFPQDNLLTEESYTEGVEINLQKTWIIDPIDGTTNYAHGFPHYCVSLAYMEDGEPVLGFVYDINRQELFWGIRGHGAFLNQTPLQVSRTATLSTALLATGFPYDIQHNPDNNLAFFLKFMPSCRALRRAGSAALDLAYLAGGRLDGFWEWRLAPWDIAAGVLLIQEAGGIVSDFNGQTLNYAQRRINILASATSSLDGEMKSILKTTAS